MSKSRQSKGRDIKVNVKKELRDLRMEVEVLRNNFQRFNIQIAQHHKQFDERSMTAWEYLWATIECLKEEGKLGFLTEENVEKFRLTVIRRWRAGALENLKKRLENGSALCKKCHHVGGAPEFYEGDSEESKCPNCGAVDTAYVKFTEEVNDS